MCPRRKKPKRNLLATAVEETDKQPLRDAAPGRVEAAMAARELGSTTLQRMMGVSDQTILYAKAQNRNTQVPTIIMLALELTDDFGVPWLIELFKEPMYRTAFITGALPEDRQKAVAEFAARQYARAGRDEEEGLKVINVSQAEELVE